VPVKNLENLSIIGEDMDKIKVPCFLLAHGVLTECNKGVDVKKPFNAMHANCYMTIWPSPKFTCRLPTADIFSGHRAKLSLGHHRTTLENFTLELSHENNKDMNLYRILNPTLI